MKPVTTRGRAIVPLLGLVLCTSGLLANENPPDGFTSLFNGTYLSGWKIPEGDNGHWKVVDGVIDYDAGSEAAGDKSLWTEQEFGDFELLVDWRIKETPQVNHGIRYILPDGSYARDATGKVISIPLPDADSGILLRGDVKNQVNIWCWPAGSGEFYRYRTDPKMPAEVRAAVTPRTQADRPVGEWNTFHITALGDRVTVVLNGQKVVDDAMLPGIESRGRLGLQHHGTLTDGVWAGAPSMMQFRNIFVRELSAIE